MHDTQFQFYESEGFKLFPCNVDKTPRVTSWRSSEAHIDASEAAQRADKSEYIGAWLPPNYVVIDVDRNHRAKDGTPKTDGLPIFEDLCAELGIPVPQTLTVRTGSGGMHLYFRTPDGTDHRGLSQKGLAESVDVRTHLGYVIAAGTNGYSVFNNSEVAELPQELLTLIQTRNDQHADPWEPDRALPSNVLRKLLSKIPAENFGDNDSWQEFITSCIAVAGNESDVIDVLETWSKSDPNYEDDPSIRKRIETFDPRGGITAGTFIYTLKQQEISKYLIDKVRMAIGAEFNAGVIDGIKDDLPFEPNYDVMSEHPEILKAAYYGKNQAMAIDLFARAVEGNLVYVTAERAFFYFNGTHWVETTGAVELIHKVLLDAGQKFYTDHSKDEDEDSVEIFNEFVALISSLSMLQRMESVLKQKSRCAHKAIDWDSKELQGTLTMQDCVMDFTGQSVVFRPGTAEEYRRLAIDLRKDDFPSGGAIPEKFRSFLADVFPDDETRKTATYVLSTMLSGSGKFRRFHIWNGPGANGKSTLMEIMKYVLGERAITYKPEVLLNKSYVQSLTPELATFRGALAAFSSETEESKRVSQGVVKNLTGNETIAANPKYKDIIQFQPSYQLVLATNYLPQFSAHDRAFIDRLLILPFNTCFYSDEERKEFARSRGITHFVPAKDPQVIMEGLKAERAEILYYLAMRYMEIADGVTIPESPLCLQAKSAYVSDNNDVMSFIEDSVEFDVSPERVEFYFTPSRDIVDYYNQENNTRASANFIVMRLKEAYPLIEKHSKWIDGRLTRGYKHIRLKLGSYPEGYQGNYTEAERTLHGEEF